MHAAPEAFRGHTSADILSVRARVGKYIAGVFFVFLPLLAAFTAVMA